MKYMFSACLLGVGCRYDGASSENAGILELWKKEGGIVVCPEQLGGLSTPRPASTIDGGDGLAVLDGGARIINERGQDVTENFLRGATACSRLAVLSGVEIAYLKGGSPSCGLRRTSVTWLRSPGCGVTAALLSRRGIKIVEVD
jgi:uncharacterized protein YbbK (DUF523 family)